MAIRCWLFGHSWLAISGWLNAQETFNVDQAGRWGIDLYICGNCQLRKENQ